MAKLNEYIELQFWTETRQHGNINNTLSLFICNDGKINLKISLNRVEDNRRFPKVMYGGLTPQTTCAIAHTWLTAKENDPITRYETLSETVAAIIRGEEFYDTRLIISPVLELWACGFVSKVPTTRSITPKTFLEIWLHQPT